VHEISCINFMHIMYDLFAEVLTTTTRPFKVAENGLAHR
jgi:hypothetical protein